jgi:molybdopterin molybdotransferase
MDGIAIDHDSWQKGARTFRIKATQAAGDAPAEIASDEECIEIMTGAALGSSVDTVIRYEDLSIVDGMATVMIEKIQRAQNIHFRGNDKKEK